jgi:hypothetical protein
MTDIDPRIVVYGMICACFVACMVNWRPVLQMLVAGPLWLAWGAKEIIGRIWKSEGSPSRALPRATADRAQLGPRGGRRKTNVPLD